MLIDQALLALLAGWEFGFLSDFLNEMQGRMSGFEAPEYGFRKTPLRAIITGRFCLRLAGFNDLKLKV